MPPRSIFWLSPRATPETLGAIRYSLAALKNIGAAAVVDHRRRARRAGPLQEPRRFRLAASIPRRLNKRGIETLAAAGAFDALEANRALVHANVEGILALAQRREANSASGTDDLFGLGATAPQLDLRAVQAWTPMERLSHEFDAIGFYLSGHPLDSYERVLQKLGVKRFAEFEALSERGSLRGPARRHRHLGARAQIAARQQVRLRHVLRHDRPVRGGHLLRHAQRLPRSVGAGHARLARRSPPSATATRSRCASRLCEALDKAAAGVQRGLKVVLDRHQASAKHVAALKSHLKHGGKGEIRLVLPLDDRGREVELVIPGRYDVSPARAGILSTTPG